MTRHGLSLVACGLLLGALAIDPARAAASSTSATLRPSFEMEGQGALVPGQSKCAADGCQGTLTSTLTGRPYRRLNLSLDLVVNPTAALDTCFPTTGTGGFGQTGIETNLGETANENEGFVTQFIGEFCGSAASDAYSLDGTLTIAPADPCHSPQTVAVGTMLVTGSVHTSGPVPFPPLNNPIPSGMNSSAIVSVVGTVGQIPAPCPSP